MPRLLPSVRHSCRRLGYSRSTEKSYTHWIRRFVVYNDKKHPHSLGAVEIEAFLTHLANERNVAASTQNLALNAIVFLYRHVLNSEVGALAFDRAKRPQRLPVVLTPDEVRCLLSFMSGTPRLVASLLYGSGMRLGEAISLRVKDVDLAYSQFLIRHGKDAKGSIHLQLTCWPPGRISERCRHCSDTRTSALR